MLTRPIDLVIGGVRKCGTTSLFEWLADHPAVDASNVKEPAYLMDRESPYFRTEANYCDHGWSRYERYFLERSADRVRVEATTRYLHQRTALEALAALDPQPHVVFLLRKPAERLLSAFRYAANNRASLRPGTSFGEFVAALKEERVTDLVGVGAELASRIDLDRELAHLPYELGYGRYAEHLEPWREAFAPDRLHVRVFEDMRDEPKKFVQELSAAIGIAPSFFDRYSFRPRNVTVPVRSHFVHRTVRRLAPAMPRKGWMRAAYRAYLRLQRRSTTRDPKIDDVLADLDDYYAPHDALLIERYGLDLARWGRR